MSLNATNGIGSPEQYVRRAFEAECQIAASTARGRNDQLNRSAFAVGQLVPSGYLDQTEAEHRLFEAALASGYVSKDGPAAAKATIASGLEKGIRDPRAIPVNGHHVPAPDRHQHQPQLGDLPIPDWTEPNADGKPKMYAIGRDEPTVFENEGRRHVYRRDGRPVRVKVKKRSGEPRWIDIYRVVRPLDGAIGWQARRPAAFAHVPYIGPAGTPSPFDPENHGEVLFWAEGEKDVDTIVQAGGLAFTFGGSSDVPDCAALIVGFEIIIVADNDAPGEKCIPRKVRVARSAGTEPRVVRFGDMHDGADASDFIEQGNTLEEMISRAEHPREKPTESDQRHAATVWESEVSNEKSQPITITAQPFIWRDPDSFPRRQWLYGYHLIRKFLSATVAPGDVGKTSLILAEAIAMASGRPLLGVPVRGGKLRVWVINLEDPREEIERRVVAICMHFKIDPSEIEGQLFLNSGRDTNVIVATATKNGTTIAQPVIDALTTEIKAKGADVVVIDPLVKAHRVPENDNGAIDIVCTAFAGIAEATDCAFDLVHHVRKTNGAEVTVEDSRGAVSLASAARSMRALNRMSKDEGEKAGIEDYRGYFRSETGKANLAPPETADWFKLVPVSLGNGDDDAPFDNSDRVAVAEPWTWPDALEGVTANQLLAVQKAVDAGRWRANAQAADWVGKAVAQVLGLDLASKAHRSKISSLLKTWIGTGMFAVVEGTDEKREKRSFVEVGEWATN